MTGSSHIYSFVLQITLNFTYGNQARRRRRRKLYLSTESFHYKVVFYNHNIKPWRKKLSEQWLDYLSGFKCGLNTIFLAFIVNPMTKRFNYFSSVQHKNWGDPFVSTRQQMTRNWRCLSYVTVCIINISRKITWTSSHLWQLTVLCVVSLSQPDRSEQHQSVVSILCTAVNPQCVEWLSK